VYIYFDLTRSQSGLFVIYVKGVRDKHWPNCVQPLLLQFSVMIELFIVIIKVVLKEPHDVLCTCTTQAT
jgi:hypothetical protein